MNEAQKKFDLYLTVLRFLVFKVTSNLKRIYMDVSLNSNEILLTAYYLNPPSELEMELLDDIVTNSSAHIPDLNVVSHVKLIEGHKDNEMHDFVVFAVNESI